ncbi:MAG: phage tail protein I [Synergistaceae bacterium]|nr:phage tail protein I [Synergistaceae bacterium]
MAKNITELSLIDIAPSSITTDENVQNIIKAIDPEILEISEDISEVFIISRIKTLPEPVLDLLAWQWHVDFYELAKNIDAKRDMVLKSISWHRKKGTRKAIIEALEMLGVEAKFIAWYEEEENKNNPYTFAIEAKLTGDFWERVDWTKPTQTIRRAILESKAARSYMSRLYVYMEGASTQTISVGGVLALGIQHDIQLHYNTYTENNLNFLTGGKITQGVEYTIGLAKNSLSEAVLRINSGLIKTAGIVHEINLNQNTNVSLTQKISVGSGIATGIYIQQ